MKEAKKAYEIQSKMDPAERDRLVMEQLPHVRYIARRIHDRLPRHVELEDLVHAGVVGLIEAIHKFDPAKDVQLGTYAKFRIRGAILDSLRKLDWSPRDLRRKARQIEEAHHRLQARLGRAASDSEAAAEMGMGQEEFQHLLHELRGLDLGYIEDLIPEGGDPDGLSRYLPNAPEQDPFYLCCRSEMRGLLKIAISELSPREQQVLSLYYFEELTLKEVGAVIGVNESRVCQIHSAVMVRLRARLQQLLALRPPAPSLQSEEKSGTRRQGQLVAEEV